MPQMVPALENGGKWHHVASERELMAAMQAARPHHVHEVPMIGTTFLCVPKLLTIVRTGALGGDTREIHGGWVYGNPLRFIADRQEIRILRDNPANARWFE
jgi:hypothetical protein